MSPVEYETDAGTLGVGPMPDRERPCLYLVKPGCKAALVLAVFNGEEEARRFCRWMGDVVERSNRMAETLVELAGMGGGDG